MGGWMKVWTNVRVWIDEQRFPDNSSRTIRRNI